MKTAYLGIDLLKPVLDALLREDCQILKLFTCPVDNVTEFNTAVIRTAQARGISHTLERITAADLEELAAQGCELLVCAGYYYRAPITDAFPMVNFPPAPGAGVLAHAPAHPGGGGLRRRHRPSDGGGL